MSTTRTSIWSPTASPDDGAPSGSDSIPPTNLCPPDTRVNPDGSGRPGHAHQHYPWVPWQIGHRLQSGQHSSPQNAIASVFGPSSPNGWPHQPSPRPHAWPPARPVIWQPTAQSGQQGVARNLEATAVAAGRLSPLTGAPTGRAPAPAPGAVGARTSESARTRPTRNRPAPALPTRSGWPHPRLPPFAGAPARQLSPFRDRRHSRDRPATACGWIDPVPPSASPSWLRGMLTLPSMNPTPDMNWTDRPEA